MKHNDEYSDHEVCSYFARILACVLTPVYGLNMLALCNW